MRVSILQRRLQNLLLSILHWRCWGCDLCLVGRPVETLSILHWRCRWGLSLTATRSCGAFNTPLEMRGCTSTRRRLSRLPRLSILHWRCGFSRPPLNNAGSSLCFQYSIGDAKPGAMEAVELLKMTWLSILHWRCARSGATAGVARSGPTGSSSLSILHWRCAAACEPCGVFKIAAFNTPLEMQYLDPAEFSHVLRHLSILHWRCGGRWT